uniref:Odorant receptor n=1 Tax=Phlebotomus papatasi TaxID=29031 RepID=A0A3F2ZEJ4_PHLPP
MTDIKELGSNLQRGRKYLDLCFNWMYLEFLRKSASPIKNTVILSIFPTIMLVCWFLMAIEVAQFKIGGNLTIFAHLMVYFGAFYQSLWKYFSFIWHDEKIKRFKNFIEDVQTSIHSRCLLSNIRYREYEKVLKYYVSFVSVCIKAMVISVLLLYVFNAYVTDFTSGLMFTIPLLSETSLFYRPINLIFQFICFAIGASIFVEGDLILVLIVGYLDAELKSIIAYILVMRDESIARENGREILKNVYSNHLRIQLILNDLRSIYWYLSIQLILTSFIYICFTFFLAKVVTISMGTFIILFNCTSLLFIFSYMSQILLNRTEEVAYALWQTSWYSLSVEDQLSFLKILHIAQKSKGLSAAGVTTISINTVVQVLKAAITYGTILFTFIN